MGGNIPPFMFLNGRMAELVYAQVSEACGGNTVRVQVPLRPPFDYRYLAI